MKKAAIYIRVSTQEQANEGYSVAGQKERLQAFAKAKDLEIHKTYTDPAYSGSTTDRPALQQLVKDIDEFDFVIVYKLDRLSRSQKDTLHLIQDVFLPNNVQFISMNESFDTSTSFGIAMVGMLAVFAELERSNITERLMMGREERAKNGLWHGGGFDPIGYNYIDGLLQINEYEAVQVREIHHLYQLGFPVSRIRKIMNNKYTHTHGDWSYDSAVNNVLTNELYIGKIEWQDKLNDGVHEAILTDDEFNKTQKMLKSVRAEREQEWKKGGRPFQAKYLLTGLLVCGNCGARYASKGNYSGRGENRYYRPYYTCYSRRGHPKHMVKDPSCRNKSWACVDLDEIIENEVAKLHFDPDSFIDSEKTNNGNSEILIKRINEIDKQIEHLIELFQFESMPIEVVTERVEKLQLEKKALKEEKEISDNSAVLTLKEAEEIANDSIDLIKSDDTERKRAIFSSLIDSIVLVDEDIQINWNF